PGDGGPGRIIDRMVDAGLAYRWNRDEFVRAWEADVFDRGVALGAGGGWAGVACRWDPDEFVRGWGADGFDRRVELVDGEVWPVTIGSWHGDTTMRVARALPNGTVTVSTSTLPTGESLPDPDCWVRPVGATPIEALGTNLL